jgi:type VI secretion system protein ImpC
MPDQEPGAESKPAVQVLDAPALLEDIINSGNLARTPRETALKLLNEFVKQIVKDDAIAADQKHDVIQKIQRQVAAIDQVIGQKVDAILHDKKFQKLEAAWRGLHYLVMNTETSTRLKLRVLCVDPVTIGKDLAQAADVDQSSLFKKVYEEEYGTYGGNPFSVLVADYEFGRNAPDIELLKNLSKVAAAAHTPLIAAASPALFDMESFTELGNPRDLAKVFESSELAAWRSFRESEDSRYVTLSLPRFLLRLPYGDKTVPVEGFGMQEDVSNGSEVAVVVPEGADEKTADMLLVRAKNRRPKVHAKYLWGSSAYVLAQRITNAFAMYGWCAAIRGPEGGGMVRSLPAFTVESEEGDKTLQCPTEIAITDRREKELDTLGFISLLHCKGTDYAAFFGGQTIHKPPVFDTDAANANAAISSRLPYILAASRFAHYLKVICRDKVGSFQTKDTLSQFLNRWIMTYVLGTDDAGQELKAQYPLREARIDVVDVPGKPGAYRAVAFLRPHFQLEELTASIRLVAELPPPAAA